MKPEYKAGEKATLRCYEALKREYELDLSGDLAIGDIAIRKDMKKFLGKEVEISDISKHYFKIKGDAKRYWFPLSIIAHNFQYGEEIVVSNDAVDWYTDRIFVEFIDGAEYPYEVVCKQDKEAFKLGKHFSHYSYRYIRKLQQPELIKIGDICFDKAEFEEATKNLRQYKGEQK